MGKDENRPRRHEAMQNGHRPAFYTLILSMLMLVVSLCPSAAKDNTQTATACGEAAIQGDNIAGARAAAVENALRNAVERHVGAMMDARSIVKNDRLLEQIYTHSRGYISEYEVIREKKADSGLYRVTVSAVVRNEELKSRLAELGVIKQMMDYPRIGVMAKDGNRKPEAHRLAGQAMAGFFTDKRFDVVAQPPVDASDRSAGAGGGSPGAVGRARHAEIMVVYALTAGASRFDEVMETVPVTLSARAVVTSTGQVLSSEQTRVFGLGDSAHGALMDGARKSAERLGPELAEDIAGWWAEYTANGLPYRIVLKLPSADGRRAAYFQEKLRSIPGVARLTERSTEKGTSQMRLTFKGRPTELKRQILDTVPGIGKIIFKGRYMEITLE